MANIMQMRRDTVDNWTLVNPIPADGEICYSIDLIPWKNKVGNGISHWTELSYLTDDYVHPLTHPPSIIVQDANNRFTSDNEKNRWEATSSIVSDANNKFVTPTEKNTYNSATSHNTVKFGSVGDNTTDNSTIFQTVINYAQSVGGTVKIPFGKYKLASSSHTDSCLLVDYSAKTQPAYNDPTRINISGDGAGNTVLNSSVANQYILKTIGGLGVAAESYDYVSGLSMTGVSTSKGIYSYNKAFTEIKDCSFSGLNTGIQLESVLSSVLSNCNFNWGSYGIVAKKGTGFSQVNAISINDCNFSHNSAIGYQGFLGSANIKFDGCNFEDNGTQGTSSAGGVVITFDGTEGATGVKFDSCYFENNSGGFDVNLVNTGTIEITHTFINCNFNRISSSKFVTNNVLFTGSGLQKAVFIGCSFDSYNDYVPNASRPYILSSGATTVTCIGCTFKDAAETTYQNIAASTIQKQFAGRIEPNGTVYYLPSGWRCDKVGTGSYNIYTDFSDPAFVVVALVNDGNFGFVERTVQGSNWFAIQTRNLSLTLADLGFNFILMRL